MIQVGLAVVDLRQGSAETATALLRDFAADAASSSKDASAYARSILDDRMQTEAFDRINDLWQKQDFAGVVTYADEMLKSQLSPANRQSLLTTRSRAEVAAQVLKAIDLARSGVCPRPRGSSWMPADKASDPRMKEQIQGLLDKIANAGFRKVEPALGHRGIKAS